jgi:hypothetical protein
MTSNTFNNSKNDNLFSSDEIKDIIILIRYCLYNHNAHCGAATICKEMRRLHVHPLPSISFIGKILRSNGLTFQRTGFY